MNELEHAWEEISADKGTIRQLRNEIRSLAGEMPTCSFRIGQITDATTLHIEKVSIAPWQQTSDGARIGTDTYIVMEKKEILPTSNGPETQKIVSAYRLETGTVTVPKLQAAETIAIPFKDDTLPVDPDFDPKKQTYTKLANQPEADTLVELITGLTYKEIIINRVTGETVKDAKNREKNRNRVIAESDRIFRAAQNEIVMTEEGERKVALTLGNQQIELFQKSQGDIKLVRTHVQDYTGRQSFTEGFQSFADSPIDYQETTMDKGKYTPVAIASEKQVDELFGVLEQLTDERVEKEVAARQTIREETDKIVARTGQRDGTVITTSIFYPFYTLEIIKYEDETPSPVVVSLAPNEMGGTFGEVQKVEYFCLNPYEPLYLMQPEAKSQNKYTTNLVTDEQRDWLVTTLSNINKFGMS